MDTKPTKLLNALSALVEKGDDCFFDLKGLSGYAAMGISSLRYHIKASGLPCFRLPGQKNNTGKILVKRSEFDQWMERYRFNDFTDPDTIANKVLEALSDC